MSDKINEEITTKLGPLMQLNINPAYQIEQRMDQTNFRETYKGEKVEATDKVYFRKKDEMIEEMLVQLEKKKGITFVCNNGL